MRVRIWMRGLKNRVRRDRDRGSFWWRVLSRHPWVLRERCVPLQRAGRLFPLSCGRLRLSWLQHLLWEGVRCSILVEGRKKSGGANFLAFDFAPFDHSASSAAAFFWFSTAAFWAATSAFYIALLAIQVTLPM